MTLFQRRLAILMKRDGTNVTALAGKTGLTRQTIYRFIKGDHVPGLDSADLIARAFKMTLTEFLGASNHSLDECMNRVQEEWGARKRH